MILRLKVHIALAAWLKQCWVQITKHVSREIICHSNFCHPHVVQFKVQIKSAMSRTDLCLLRAQALLIRRRSCNFCFNNSMPFSCTTCQAAENVDFSRPLIPIVRILGRLLRIMSYGCVGGLSHARAPGNSHGVCAWWRHVPACQAAQRAARTRGD